LPLITSSTSSLEDLAESSFNVVSFFLFSISCSPHSRHFNGSHEPKTKSKLNSDTVRSSSPLRRPRDHKTIMAEAKEKLEEQRRRREDEERFSDSTGNLLN
jgi:hypothetical protein